MKKAVLCEPVNVREASSENSKASARITHHACAPIHCREIYPKTETLIMVLFIKYYSCQKKGGLGCCQRKDISSQMKYKPGEGARDPEGNHINFLE